MNSNRLKMIPSYNKISSYLQTNFRQFLINNNIKWIYQLSNNSLATCKLCYNQILWALCRINNRQQSWTSPNKITNQTQPNQSNFRQTSKTILMCSNFKCQIKSIIRVAKKITFNRSLPPCQTNKCRNNNRFWSSKFKI